MANLDFLSDLRHLATLELTMFGYPPSPSDDVDTVLGNLLNLRRRLPRVIPWKMELSSEVENKTLPPAIQEGLTGFIEKARTGEDLKPYLSKGINDPSYSDLMFYDWGIYHFHLGKELERSGFIKRTNELLFAVTDQPPTTMYLVDIHPHAGAFANQDLLRILEENWPVIMDQHALQDVVELDYNPSDEAIGRLRKAGINAFLRTPGGRTLAPMGGGITSAGTSLSSMRDILKIKKIVRKLQDEIPKNRNAMADQFRAQYNKSWDDLEIRMTAFGAHIEVREITTGEILLRQGI
ncbi:MAG: hypothetical protein WBG50_16410 [Desulfomonilaceae bacterium]